MHKMTTFTLSIPDELKKKIDAVPEVNWPEYLKKRIEQRIKEFCTFEELKNSGRL